MMKCIKLLTILLSVCLIWGVGSAAERQVALEGTQAGPDVTKMTLLEQSAEAVRLRVSVGGFSADSLSTPIGEFTSLGFRDRGCTHEVGLPRLPVIHEFIEIPNGTTADVILVGGTYQDYSLADLGITAPIFPAQEPMEKSVEGAKNFRFTIDEKAYGTSGFYPGTLYSLETPAMMRNHTVVGLYVNPIQYDPVAGTLRCYSEMYLDVVIEGRGTPVDDRFISPMYERMASETIFNYTAPQSDRILSLDLGYLIITNSAFSSYIQPLADWKAQKGFEVTVADENDMTWTAAGIKSYVQTAYDTWTIPPTGVLLVGDDTYLPTFNANAYSGYTDLDYRCLAGGDDFPDIFYSRMPARSGTDATAMVNKILDYEKVENLGTGWFDQGAFLASSDQWETGEGTQDYVTSTFFEPAGVTCHKIYARLGGGTTEINSNLNAGRTVCIYTGHGSTTSWGEPAFDIPGINALTNTGMYPFVNSHACITADFSVTECYGEAWVKRANKGAITFWGSVPSTYWDEDDWLERAAWEEHFDNDLWTFGELTDQALINIWSMTSLNEYYIEGYQLFGDWSVALWTATPAALTVNHPAVIPLGPSTASVTVNDGGTPVENALVCILQDGQFQAAAYTDGTGLAQVACSPLTVDNCTLTVTGHNLAPYSAEILVGVDGPYPVAIDHAIDDDNSGSSSGNGDGTANPGETIELTLTVMNYGNETAYGVSATLASTDPHVSIIDGTAGFGNIAADTSATNLDELVFSVLVTCTDGHSIPFTVTTTDGVDNWESNFSIQVAGAVLGYYGHSVTDSPLGNDDGDADPGETISMPLSLENVGQVDVTGVSATLTHDQPSWITLIDDTASYAGIDQGNFEESIGPHFKWVSDYDTPCGTKITFTVDVATNEGSCSDTFTVQIGGTGVGFSDDMESGQGDWTHNAGQGTDDWAITNSSYAHSPANCWFSSDVSSVKDVYLYTPIFTVTALSEITFWHRYNMESGYDGCVIEIQDGLMWTDLGPYITQGGYNDSISTCCSNPIGGRSAWSGDSGSTMVEVVVDLSAWQGDTTRIRYRLATDSSVSDEGWYIDDVEITGAECQPYSGSGSDTVAVTLACVPDTGVVPFSSNMAVSLENITGYDRRVAGRVAAQIGNGNTYSNFRSGWTNLNAYEVYNTSWSQNFPALGSVIGLNTFTLTGEDVTPAPYNQPPNPPSGDTDQDSCAVTATAP